jgi:hypothetical protein
MQRGLRRSWRTCVSVCIVMAAACGGDKSPAGPTPPSQTTLTAPTASAPAEGAQTGTLRPTLTVTNGTSSGARTYEFQISDRSDFAATSTVSAYYPVNVTRANVAEGSGSTSLTLDVDLQPATRFYWRARLSSGGTTSSWTATRTFLSQIVGYTKPGEIYDPLVNGETVAEFRWKRTSFVAGRGLLVDDSDSYARYRLITPISNGEFSLDIEGISDHPVSENPDTAKLKILSMCDCLGALYQSDWLMNVQYRGLNGNPDNAVSFKMLLGEDEDDHKLEPDLNKRRESVRHFNPSNTYYWKVTWNNFIQVLVQDGGTSPTGIGGTTVYDYGQTSKFFYSPPLMWAYLGVNDSGSETGSWPHVIYRNVWIGDKPRPTSIGSAFRPQ